MIAVIYHIIFFILAGLVLLNLMVGVIIGSIFEAKAGMDGDKLEVTIVRASNLPKADLFGGSDPFVTVIHQDETKSTKVVKSCLNPKWNQMFEFDMEDRIEMATSKKKNIKIKSKKLKFIVYDWDLIGSDDALGDFCINYENLRWNKPVSFELELDHTPEDQEMGTLFVTLKKVAGPNHILLDAEKDKWDRLMDKYYVAKELLQESKATLQRRRKRKKDEKRKEKIRNRWSMMGKDGNKKYKGKRPGRLTRLATLAGRRLSRSSSINST